MTLFMYLVALVLILIYPLYLYITKPLNRIKRHGDLGYHFGTPEVRFEMLIFFKIQHAHAQACWAL